MYWYYVLYIYISSPSKNCSLNKYIIHNNNKSFLLQKYMSFWFLYALLFIQNLFNRFDECGHSNSRDHKSNVFRDNLYYKGNDYCEWTLERGIVKYRGNNSRIESKLSVIIMNCQLLLTTAVFRPLFIAISCFPQLNTPSYSPIQVIFKAPFATKRGVILATLNLHISSP